MKVLGSEFVVFLLNNRKIEENRNDVFLIKFNILNSRPIVGERRDESERIGGGFQVAIGSV